MVDESERATERRGREPEVSDVEGEQSEARPNLRLAQRVLLEPRSATAEQPLLLPSS